jgi:hypothetical protein
MHYSAETKKYLALITVKKLHCLMFKQNTTGCLENKVLSRILGLKEVKKWTNLLNEKLCNLYQYLIFLG